MVGHRFFGDYFLAREAVSWSHGGYTFVGVARILGDFIQVGISGFASFNRELHYRLKVQSDC